MRSIETAWWRLVKFGFRLLYHEMAFTYDLVANVVSLGQWWDWQRSALQFLPTPAEGWILELAYGTGHLQTELYQGGWRSIGLDFSPQMGRIAYHRLVRRKQPIRLTRGKAQALPFPEKCFVAIVSTFPTPFITEPATLAEVNRVLVPGGRLVFVPNGVLTKGGVAREALEKAYEVTGQRGGWGVELEACFAEQGFLLTRHMVEYPHSIATVLVAQKKP